MADPPDIPPQQVAKADEAKARDETEASSQEEPQDEDSSIGWLITLNICVLLFLVAGGALFWIYNSEPEATRGGATRTTAMLVDVVEVERGDHHPMLTAMGTVLAAREVMLSPRVEGEVIERAEHFTPGGRVEAGEVLVTLDPADYEIALEQRRSDLQQAETDLAIEQGRQAVARQDYEFLDQEISEDNQALVLRKPQLQAQQATVRAAEAAVERAELDLERTEIKAPFDALVLDRAISKGSQVSPGSVLGHLVGTDTYWVEATVPLSMLQWMRFPDSPEEQGAAVRVRNQSAWTADAFREGHLLQQVGTLDRQTRLGRVLVAVADPLALQPEHDDKPTLVLDSYVEAHIQLRQLDDVIRLDRDHLHQNNTVWVMTDGKLDIREVEVILRDQVHAYIRPGTEPGTGLHDGERVVTSQLASVVEGAELRLNGGEEADDDESDSDGQGS